MEATTPERDECRVNGGASSNLMSQASHNMDKSQQLIDSLQRAEAYPSHPTQAIKTIETHSAWVLLTGQYAYKIKKPVNFGFLDFSTLEKRRHYCQLEVALNGRFSPDIYLAVVKITGPVSAPVIDESLEIKGDLLPVLEYAVKMRQFAEGCLLSDLANNGQLTPAHIDALARSVAQFHLTTEVAPAKSPDATLATISHWTLENFQHIYSGDIAQPTRQKELRIIHDWINRQLITLAGIFGQRQQLGFMRNCHGDLHLKNLTLMDNQVRLFDCIEFNDELRWIDVISEIAFLVMDLQVRGLPELSNQFLNQYLQVTGDYSGLRVLTFYRVYRALVRAKVALLRCQQLEKQTAEFTAAKNDFARYIEFINHCMLKPKPLVVVTVGFSGSGKSTLVKQLNAKLGTIQIRSDVERKRLQGLAAEQRSDSSLNEGLYSAGQSDDTYQKLNELAEAVLASGYAVVLDATFLQQKYRQAAAQLAETHQVPFIILHCMAPVATLNKRIARRDKLGVDPSEATSSVLAHQLSSWQPLNKKALAQCIEVDTTDGGHVEKTLAQIKQLIK